MSTETGRRQWHSDLPTRSEWVDLVAATTLSLGAGVGFHTSFGGWLFLRPVAIAAVLGALIGFVGGRLKLAAIVMAGASVLGFLVFGGAASVYADTIFGLPTRLSLVETMEGAVRGWGQLLTIIPPSGQEGNLLIVPFITTYASAVLSVYTAVRTRRVGLPACFPAAAASVAVLWGTDRPAALLVQGCGFVVVLVLWMRNRQFRDMNVVANLSKRRQWLWAVALLGLAAAAAPTVTSAMPLVDSHRYVLRDQVQPPVDLSKFASPLAEFPFYAAPDKKTTPLLEVSASSPLPANSRLALAAMDVYDGQVFAVDAVASQGSGTFVKTGTQLPKPPAGTSVDLDITVASLGDVWLPAIGEPTSVTVVGRDQRARDFQKGLRFNGSTRALIFPSKLQNGDEYRLTTVVAATPPTDALTTAQLDTGVPIQPVPGGAPWIKKVAQSIADGASAKTPYAKVKAVIDALHDHGANDPNQNNLHSLLRLSLFTQDYVADPTAGFIGTPEQFAATAALLLRALDVPSRVVVGFKVPDGKTKFTVTGGDVTAWVEVPFSGLGWVPLDPVPPVGQVPPPTPKTVPKETANIPPEPPPPAVPPVPEVKPTSSKGDAGPKKSNGASSNGQGIPSIVVGAAVAAVSIPLGALLVGSIIVLLKVLRRRKRRVGAPVRRLAGAWDDLVDHAKDAGLAIPARATRAEAGALLTVASARRAADLADEALFGPTICSSAHVDAVRDSVDAAIQEMRAGQSRLDRLRTAVNLASFSRR